MTPSEILAECRRAGVDLNADGSGGLSYRGDREIVAKLLPAIKRHKPELVRLLSAKAEPANEPPTAELWVICWTPAGAPLRIRARDAAHAEQLRQWNPEPAGEFALLADRPAPAQPEQVRCADCQHSQKTGHAVLIDCGIGRQPPGACGAWWGLDLHFCKSFEELQP